MTTNIFPFDKRFQEVFAGEGEVMALTKEGIATFPMLLGSSLWLATAPYGIGPRTLFANEEGDRLRLDCGWISSMAFPNAFAYQTHEYAACAVRASCAFAASEISKALFSSESFFPALGDPSVGKQRSTMGAPLGFLHWKGPATLSAEERDEYYRGLDEMCPIRKEAAYLLAVSFLEYIWHHEFVHVLRGHTAFRFKSKGLPCRLNERIDGAGADNVNDSTRRVFCEYAADNRAAFSLLYPDSFETIENGHFCPSVEKRDRLTIRMLAPILTAMVWVVADVLETGTLDLTPEIKLNQTHPNSALRLYATTNCTIGHADRFYGEEGIQGFKRAGEEIINIGKVDPSYAGLVDLFSNAVGAAYKEQNERMKELSAVYSPQYKTMAYTPVGV